MNPRTAIQKGIDALTPPRNNEEDEARRALTKLLDDTGSAPKLAAELLKLLQVEDSNKHALQQERDELTEDKPLRRRFHFTFGDSNAGPLGMCAEVIADTRAEAIRILSEALPEDHPLFEGAGGQGFFPVGADGLEYVRLYFNGGNVQASDIDEETPTGLEPVAPGDPVSKAVRNYLTRMRLKYDDANPTDLMTSEELEVWATLGKPSFSLVDADVAEILNKKP